jgi:hypothetical protein
MRREPSLTAVDVLLAVKTLSFDIHVLELWLPLTVGARAVVLSRRRPATDSGWRRRCTRRGHRPAGHAGHVAHAREVRRGRL